MELTRREFLQWSLVTGAAVAFAGCGMPPHQALVSQAELPEYRLPGSAHWFATTCQDCSGGCSVSVRVIDGRAKKLEGIPAHPINHGKLCAKGHSSLQALYHPERLTAILKRQGSDFVASQDWNEGINVLSKQLSSSGKKLWITGSLYGTLGALIVSTAQKAGAKLWVLDFPGRTTERAAMKALTGKAELPYHDIAKSDYVVNFGSDFLLGGNLPVHDAWAYGEFRQGKNRAKRGTLISFSPRMNLSDGNSDRWVPIRPGTEGWVAVGIGNALAEAGKKGWPAWATKIPFSEISQLTDVSEDIFHRVAKKLIEAKHPLAIAGSENGMVTNGVWAISAIESLNRLLAGKIVSFDPDLLPDLKAVPANLFVSTQQAMSGLKNGQFETVWVMETNPRYLLPSKLKFDELFAKVKNKTAFSLYRNETTLLADWVFPTQTWLESWGDRLMAGPWPAIYNLQQPVMQARAGTKSLGDIVLMAAGQSESVQDLLKNRVKDESIWENMLVRGGAWKEAPLDWEAYLGENTHPIYPPPVVKNQGKPPAGVNPWTDMKKPNPQENEKPEFAGDGHVLIPFYSPNLGDGSLANRPWMQELPDPVTTVVWTHWIELPIPLANKLGVERGDVIKLTSANGAIMGPAYPNLALHPDAVAVPVGQGHFHYGEWANRGANPLSIIEPLWQKDTGELAWVGTRVNVEKVGKKTTMTTYDQRMDRFAKEFLPL